MNTIERNYILNSSEYRTQFINALRHAPVQGAILNEVNADYGMTSCLPKETAKKYEQTLHRESVFRNIATVMNCEGKSEKILAKVTKDFSDWIPVGEEVPVYDGADDFSDCFIHSHRLTAFMRFDSVFVNDASFDIEKHITDAFGKSFANTEDNAFINGNGNHKPIGILDSEKGAEIGVTATNIGFDNIVKLYFSLDKQYRKNAVWLMNDETAFALRTVKDNAGNYIWNYEKDTILGKPVIISNDMPSAEERKCPIAFGDFSYYRIICFRPVCIRVLTEIFALNDQVGNLAQEFLDGRLIRREAIKTLKINEEIAENG